MKKSIISLCAFVMLFGFAVTGAMAQTWTWGEPITLTVTAPELFLDIEAYPDYPELSGSFDGSIFEDLAPYFGDTLPSTLKFQTSDISPVLKSVIGPNGVTYVINDVGDTLGFQLPGQTTPTAFAEDDQPFIPTLSGKFISLAVGIDGTLYVLFETTTETITQHILIGTPPTATVRFTPRSLNLGSQGKWVTCKISNLPDGYKSKDIEPDSLCIIAINDEVLDAAFCRDPEGPAGLGKKMMVKFLREDLIGYINAIDSNATSAKLTMAGYSKDGYLQFYGEDSIKTKPAKTKKPKK